MTLWYKGLCSNCLTTQDRPRTILISLISSSDWVLSSTSSQCLSVFFLFSLSLPETRAPCPWPGLSHLSLYGPLFSRVVFCWLSLLISYCAPIWNPLLQATSLLMPKHTVSSKLQCSSFAVEYVLSSFIICLISLHCFSSF